MPEKPTTAAGYTPDHVARVKSTCLYLATKLGDFLDLDFIGPRRVAGFLYGRPDPETQADAVGFVRQIIQECNQ
jgi:hypothetical protein